jgi:hypothetical protein
MIELDKDIEKIKVSRMKPEERFMYNFLKNNFIKLNEDNNDIIYSFNDNILIYYNKMEDYYESYSSNSLHKILRNEFNMLYSERRLFINKMCHKYLKNYEFHTK